MPNAGLPDARPRTAPRYPLTPAELADAHDAFAREFGLAPGRRLLRHHAGAPARRSSSAVGGRAGRARAGRAPEPGVASLYQPVPFRQDTAYLSIGERTNANGSKAFREAMLEPSAGTTASRSPATRSATARTCSTCASTTSAATASPTCARSPAGSPPPPRCRSCSTPPSRAVLEAGLELLGGRAVVNSVNYEDGDGPGSPVRPDHAAGPRARRRRRRADHRRGGPGPHRRVEGRGRRAADRRPDRHVGDARRATSSSTA